MNPFSSHIAYEILLDMVDGRLEATQHQRYRAHLATCQRCTTELSNIQGLLILMRSDKSKDAPPFAIAGALSLFKPLAVAKPERRSLLALLRFDSAERDDASTGYALGTITFASVAL